MNWLVAFDFGVAALDFCAMTCNILKMGNPYQIQIRR